jgi:hypothetical protein
MLNTAICLVGHMNTFHRKKIHEPILKIIKNLNADVYVCTSTMMTSPQKSKPLDATKSGFKKVYIPPRRGCLTVPHHYGWGLQMDPILTRAYLKQKLGDTLKDIKIIDQNIEAINKSLPPYLWEYQKQAELLKLKECFNMIEEVESTNGVKYDAVIKCRLDVCLKNPRQFDVIVKSIRNIIEKKDKCIVNLGGWACPKSHNLRAFFYGFCYGDRGSMNKLANIIKVEDTQIYDDRVAALGSTVCEGAYLEPIVSHYLDINGIRIEYECTGAKRTRKYEIVRELPSVDYFKKSYENK